MSQINHLSPLALEVVLIAVVRHFDYSGCSGHLCKHLYQVKLLDQNLERFLWSKVVFCLHLQELLCWSWLVRILQKVLNQFLSSGRCSSTQLCYRLIRIIHDTFLTSDILSNGWTIINTNIFCLKYGSNVLHLCCWLWILFLDAWQWLLRLV
jgi:hypothetical protein